MGSCADRRGRRDQNADHKERQEAGREHTNERKDMPQLEPLTYSLWGGGNWRRGCRQISLAVLADYRRILDFLGTKGQRFIGSA